MINIFHDKVEVLIYIFMFEKNILYLVTKTLKLMKV